jgi:uncharacterized spore protein YtfJ
MGDRSFDANSYYDNWAFGAGFATGVVISSIAFALLMVLL